MHISKFNSNPSKEDLMWFLSLDDKSAQQELFTKALEVRNEHIGNKVFLRGLIEYSNICYKDCYYCGIRSSNDKKQLYTISHDEVLEAALFAHEQNYGSIVIQTGEQQSSHFVQTIETLIKDIKKISHDKLGITLSCGEQTEDTYKRWFDAGAHRYLLRIETSNEKLYSLIHPQNPMHSFKTRVDKLALLKKLNYQVGTGVMIGLPSQTIEDLANDLLFFKQIDIDMVGMGPYIEHVDTPLYILKNKLLTLQERFDLSLRMVATLRLYMPAINMAATTAMQAIDPMGREKAIKAGANIIMPNLTPVKYRSDYQLYDGKPCLDEDAAKCTGCMILRIKSTGSDVGLGEWGDSKHFLSKVANR